MNMAIRHGNWLGGAVHAAQVLVGGLRAVFKAEPCPYWTEYLRETRGR